MSAAPDLTICLDLGQAAQRRLVVTVEFATAALRARTCDLMLPVWTPGSYMVREFSRHLVGVVARDPATGARLDCVKTTKNRYRVAVGGARRVSVSYVVYAHELSVRTAYATGAYAFWNGACTYLWPVPLTAAAARLEIELPAGWSVWSGLHANTRREGRSAIVEFTGLDQAVDTPFLAGDLDVREFTAGDRPFRFVFAGLGPVTPPAELIDDTRAIVDAARDVFRGALPVAEYTFLSVHTDTGRGGLEHESSSLLMAPRTTFRPRRSYEDYVGLVAHEFFHVWNVKRMRPHELWSFDYESENYSELLWVAEGFTAYYDDLLCLRAGILSPKRYLEIVAGHIRTLRGMHGRFEQSLAEASFDAWIRFYRPDENTRNSTQNYYSNGALAGLIVDAAIRRGSRGTRSLDDAMRDLFAESFGAGRGYTFEDVAAAVSRAAGSDLDDWLRTLVSGPFDPDFGQALETYGLHLVTPKAPPASLGLTLRGDDSRIQSVDHGGPAWLAGLCPDDEVLALDGLRVTKALWSSVFENVVTPGRAIDVLVSRRGRIVTTSVVPIADTDSQLEIDTVKDPSAVALEQRRAWLGSVAIT